jgi:hypothetical protein
MRLRKNYLHVLWLFFTGYSVLAQGFDDGTQPPPTSIDDYIGILGIVAVFSAFFFYKRTFKLKQDDNTVT